MDCVYHCFLWLGLSNTILSVNGDKPLLYGLLFIWKADIKFIAGVKILSKLVFQYQGERK